VHERASLITSAAVTPEGRLYWVVPLGKKLDDELGLVVAVGNSEVALVVGGVSFDAIEVFSHTARVGVSNQLVLYEKSAIPVPCWTCCLKLDSGESFSSLNFAVKSGTPLRVGSHGDTVGPNGAYHAR